MPDAPRRIRKAWAIRTTSHEIGIPADIFFAPTRSKARAECIYLIQDSWGCTWLEAAEGITSIRRAPERDVHLPPRHSFARVLAPSMLDIVVHAYGGRGLKAGYRDYFFTNRDDADLRALVDVGLFSRGREYPREVNPDQVMAYFHLTDLGRLVAAGEQPEYPDA